MSLLTATREEQLHRVATVPMVFPATPVPPPAVGNAEPQVLRQRQQLETGQAPQNGSDQKFWQRQSNSGGINRSNGADLPSSSGDAGGFRGDDTSHNKDGGSETPTATSFLATEQAELATARRPGDGDPGGDEARWRRLSKDELLWFGDRCAAQAPGTGRRQTLVAAAAGVASTTPKRGEDAAEPCDGDWRRRSSFPSSPQLSPPLPLFCPFPTQPPLSFSFLLFKKESKLRLLLLLGEGNIVGVTAGSWGKTGRVMVFRVRVSFSKIKVMVHNETGSITLLLWDKETTQLCKKRVKQVMEDDVISDNAYPPTFDNMMDRKVLFKINVKFANIKGFEQIYTVIKICDDEDIIGKNMPKEIAENTSTFVTEIWGRNSLDMSENIVNIKSDTNPQFTLDGMKEYISTLKCKTPGKKTTSLLKIEGMNENEDEGQLSTNRGGRKGVKRIKANMAQVEH
ncbi:uncharacterized protein DS421_12g365350 [Arachis hypogaea]|nr:uncharacterized protein DS421_12g365350 [Arachis hypogaea]